MKLLALLAFLGVAFSQTNYCDNEYECEDDTISNTYVYCYGYFACDTADITATYGYYYGFYGAYLADMNSYYTYAYGFYALYYADVLARAIYAYGFYGAIYANVEPRTSYLYAYMYGYHAGLYTDLLCYSGDYCYVYCGVSTGCYLTKFYCYSGAVCYYHCDNADYCPTLYGGVGSTITFEGETKAETYDGLTDDQIKAKHVENKKIKEKMKGTELDNLELPGETEEAKAARQAVDQQLLAKDGVFSTKSVDNSMIYGGAAVGTICFVMGLLFGNRFKGSDK